MYAGYGGRGVHLVHEETISDYSGVRGKMYVNSGPGVADVILLERLTGVVVTRPVEEGRDAEGWLHTLVVVQHTEVGLEGRVVNKKSLSLTHALEVRRSEYAGGA